ncbi:MAG: extracellular solute-binding protein [Firmicutes bacterium]|nr:extracellular solute-binding protein [Bacillota bacterium]
MKSQKRWMVSAILFALTALILVSGSITVFASGNLVIYSPATRATSDMIVEMFREKHPDIQVDIVSAGTGELATRIRAERARPGGDIMLTGGTETMDSLLDLLEPYKNINDAAFGEQFKHPEYYYYAFSLPLQVFIVNTTLVSEEEAPKTWTELGDSKWKGKLIWANPSVSGSAYAQLGIMLQLYGWDLVENVINNASITSSSRISYQNVANGEYAIGMTGEANVFNLMEEGYPVIPIYPKDGTALRFDTVSIIKNGPNPENAKKFMDFITSKEAMTRVAMEESRRMGRVDVPVKPGLLPTDEIVFMDYDEGQAAAKKAEILEKFDDLFAAKGK